MADEVGSAPLFTLEYDIQPQDVRELVAGPPRARYKLIIAVVAAIAWGLITVAVTVITLTLTFRSSVHSSDGSLGGVYLVDVALCLTTALSAWVAWQRSPGRLARVAVKRTPEFQGRACDYLETEGIRSITANGIEVFHPWSAIDQVRETTRAFQLLDHNGGIRAVLPKRVLGSPDLLLALRAFLQQAIQQEPPAAASTAADESQL